MARPGTRDVFAHTLDLTARWLDDIGAETGWETQRAYSVLRAVLHVLRDRLTADEAAHLGAQLPMLIRGFYFDDWRPSAEPLKYRHKDDFLERVGQRCPGLGEDERELAVRAVFKVLVRHIADGEIDQVKHQLPADVRSLWTTTL